jgi:hypothetical protein
VLDPDLALERKRRDTNKPKARSAWAGGAFGQGRDEHAQGGVKRSCAIGYRGRRAGVKGRLHNCACRALRWSRPATRDAVTARADRARYGEAIQGLSAMNAERVAQIGLTA